jgi:sugar O-acyltransferase (sialic acid O-acetyltransferase NeuD family)
MPEKPLILIGGGGHCKSCIDVIEASGAWEIKGILDQNLVIGHLVLNYPVIGTDDDIDRWIKAGYYFLITVGQIKSAKVRERIFSALKIRDAKIATVISPNATVSKHANIGEGTIVHHCCVINAGANLGVNNIVNTGSIIEHDARVGNNNHISTRSVLNGDVTIGNACFVGSGSVILNGVSITDNVVIGAGSLIINSIEEPGVYAGSPIKRIGK